MTCRRPISGSAWRNFREFIPGAVTTWFHISGRTSAGTVVTAGALFF